MGLRLVAFDLDGTLLPGTTVSLILADRFDHRAEMDALEARYARGEIGNDVVASESARHFAGVPLAALAAALADAPFIAGIAATVAALRAAGIVPIVATVTLRPAARIVAERFGFAAASGTEMGIREGCLTGVITRHFDGRDKAAFVRAEAAARGFALADCAAVGDSRSDLPTFAIVGRAIALNATPDAVAAASLSLRTGDLRDVLPHLLR
ncbi:MAG: HAD family hydrolase [Alphaproteobacteria bacterium]